MVVKNGLSIVAKVVLISLGGKGTPRGGTKIKRRRNLEREGDVRLASVGLRVEKGRGLRVGGATNHLALCSY